MLLYMVKSADVIKDLEMVRSSWIIWVVPKCHHKREADNTLCIDRSRQGLELEWYRNRQEMLAVTRS